MVDCICPDLQHLETLLNEDPGEDDLADMVVHVEGCVACQQALERITAAPELSDPVLRGMTETVPEEAALTSLMTHWKAVDPAAVADTELSFLQAAARPGVLGLLGPYEVEAEIGRGGMGVVLKALDPVLNRPVALKVLLPCLSASTTARRRFVREGRAVAAVCDEHIVSVFGVHEANGLPYLVMPYIAGESVQDRLDRLGALPLMEVVSIGYQTAAGLAAAHAKGLIHRDIKPANLLLECLPEEGARSRHSAWEYRVKITDFGLAFMADDFQLTQAGMVAGTPQYMSPEQASGEAVDHRADLFSLASVLYALCTGVPPFRAETPLAVLRQVSDTAPRPVRSLKPEVPAWLETLISGLLVKDPAGRYQSAAEVAALLEGYLAHLRQPETVPAPKLRPLPPEACAGTPRSRLATWLRSPWLPALVGVAALGLCPLLLLQATPPPQQPFATEVYCDFRGGRPLPSSFTLQGPDANQEIKHEEKGLRITLPATRQSNAPVGVATTFPVAGDFEITGTYELLSADRPPGGNGVAVALNIATDNDLTKFGKVSRSLRAQEGDVYQTEFWIKGQPDSGEHQFIPTTARAGQLRLVREGSTLRFLVADGPEKEFEEINRREFTTEDLDLVRFVANNSGSPAGLDVRLIDLRIRSRPAQRGVIGWLTKPLGIALGFMLSVLCALGVLFYVRRRTQEENPAGAKRSLRRLWLVALAALTTLGLVLWPFGAGGANGKPGELKPGELKEVLFHDFRHPPTPPSFSFWREPEGKFLKAEPEGMRITTPATYIHPFGGIGYLIEQPFDGDFEVTATVEVLHADRPAGWGVGVLLAVNKGDPTLGEWGSMSRQTRAQSGQVLYCYQSLDGSFEETDEPCTDRVGKLRLKRTGSTLSYLWAPGLKGEAFRTIHQCELGTEPIQSVRLTAVTGRQPCKVDVRLIDVQIRCGPASPASPASLASILRRKGRLAVALGFILVLLFGLGAFLHMRRRALAFPSPGVPGSREGGEHKPGSADLEAAAPLIAFPCSGCGKNLRARAALAGKSLKCPACGQVVRAPATHAVKASASP